MTGISGFATQKKGGKAQFATVSPVRPQQYGLDVAAQVYYRFVANDAAEAGSTETSIVATAHVARVGDVIQWTSGSMSGLFYRVAEVSTDEIVPAEAMEAAPGTNSFAILRAVLPRANADGEAAVDVTLSPAAAVGLAFADSVVHDYAGGNVTTAAWVELIAATAAEFNKLFVWDSSGRILELGVGGAGSEERVFLIPPGGINGPIDLQIAAGVRLSVKAIDATADAGYLVLTGLE